MPPINATTCQSGSLPDDGAKVADEYTRTIKPTVPINHQRRNSAWSQLPAARLNNGKIMSRLAIPWIRIIGTQPTASKMARAIHDMRVCSGGVMLNAVRSTSASPTPPWAATVWLGRLPFPT